MGVRVLGVTLTTAQEILYWFLLPTLLSAALFITEIALVVGVAQHHFVQGDLRWGFATVAVLYTPSVAWFVSTVSQPGAWDGDAPLATARWFGARLAQLLLFPAWAVYRYGKRLFWSVEALLSRGQLREQALDKASRPSRIELYLFAHAFLHSAPQAALQLGVTLVQCRLAQPVNDSQVLSVLTSLGVLALTLASFQRFESQRAAGRREPWRLEPATPLDRGKPTAQASTLPRSESTRPATPRLVEVHVEPDEKVTRHTPSPPSTPSATSSLSSSSSSSSASLASSSSLPSLHPSSSTPPAPAPIQRPSAPPPPAPSAPLLPPEEVAPSLPLPTRRRTESALEEDDPLGRSVAAVGWLLFLVARYGAVLSLASFRPGVVAGVLGAHVAVAGVYLVLDLQRYTAGKVVQRCSLALVFVLCPLEYGVRFARPRLVFAAFLAAACAEDAAMILGWYLGDLEDDDTTAFWHGYLVAVVFGARALSLLCLALYLALLRPKVTTFYVD